MEVIVSQPELAPAPSQGNLTERTIEELVAELEAKVYRLSLVELVASREEINQRCAAIVAVGGATAVPEPVWNILGLVDDLLMGKVDGFGEVIKVRIPEYLERLQAAYAEQCDRANRHADRLKDLLRQALEFAAAEGRKNLQGAFWRARLQNNSGPSVTVTDLAALPVEFKTKRMTIEVDLHPEDTAAEQHWSQIVSDSLAAGMKVTAEVEHGYSSERLHSYYKAADGNPPPLPGVTFTRGKHVRLEPGKGSFDVKTAPLNLPASEVRQ